MAVEFERGYLILANNTDSVDYLSCARALAKSLRYHMPDCKICLVTNDSESDPVFDFVKSYPFPTSGGWFDDWQAFYASPFRQTIKIEADILITQNIEHWWTWFEHRDVVVSKGARNYFNDLSDFRGYRRLFDDNDLPDVYNAITYWRLSKTASEFFATVRTLFEQWTTARKSLKFCDELPANTDMIYAMASKMLDESQVTLPGDWPNLIHMKPAMNFCKTDARPWTDEYVWEFDHGGIRINTIEQMWPFHYQEKIFALEAEKYYDQLLESSSST